MVGFFWFDPTGRREGLGKSGSARKNHRHAAWTRDCPGVPLHDFESSDDASVMLTSLHDPTMRPGPPIRPMARRASTCSTHPPRQVSSLLAARSWSLRRCSRAAPAPRRRALAIV